jgi:tetratricopeptide (TPR) repeat protein
MINMRSEKGRQLHQQALAAQENGDYLGALKLEMEALLTYSGDGDDAGYAEALAMEVLTLNMIGDRTGNRDFYILAMHIAMASLELAEKAKAPTQIALAHGAVGRVMDRAEKFEEAASHFDKAVEIFSQTAESQKSVIADFKNHAATSRLNGGQLDQEQVALAALAELEQTGDASDYELKVWKSGGLMRLATGMGRNGKMDEAKKYLAQAEEVIIGDEALKVRREQIATLKQKLGI